MQSHLDIHLVKTTNNLRKKWPQIGIQNPKVKLMTNDQNERE